MIETRHRFDWVLRTNPDAVFITSSTTNMRTSKSPNRISFDKTTPSYALSGIERSPRETKVVFNLRAAPDILMWPIREKISDVDRFFDTFIERGVAGFGIGYGIAWILGASTVWPFTLAASTMIAVAQERADFYDDMYDFANNPNYVPHSDTPLFIEVPT